MDNKEIKSMRDDELAGQLKTLRTRLFELRQQGVTGKVEDVSQMGKTRRDIARLLTEQQVRFTKANPDTRKPRRVKPKAVKQVGISRKPGGSKGAAKAGAKAGTPGAKKKAPAKKSPVASKA